MAPGAEPRFVSTSAVAGRKKEEYLKEPVTYANMCKGSFDPAARQRGFQVYQNVCSACHALGLLHYRDLAEIGYDAEQVKAFAAATEADDGPNDEGEMFKRPGRAADKLNVSYGAISGSMAQTWLAKGAKLFDKYGLDVNLVYISGGPRSIMALIGRTRCQK